MPPIQLEVTDLKDRVVNLQINIGFLLLMFLDPHKVVILILKHY